MFKRQDQDAEQFAESRDTSSSYYADMLRGLLEFSAQVVNRVPIISDGRKYAQSPY